MSKRSIGRVAEVLSGLFLCSALGACAPSKVAYSGPGWYLEKPRQWVAMGPQIFGGPFPYEQCEVERTKLPNSTAENMLCIQELVPPGRFGPY